MGFRQCSTDFEFFANSETALRSFDAKEADTSRFATLNGYEIEDFTKLHFQFAGNQFGEFILRIFHIPTIEISGFLVVMVKDLRNDTLVAGVTKG